MIPASALQGHHSLRDTSRLLRLNPSAPLIHAARYYMKRKAYIAAANRAQNAVKEYPRTPATEEALYIMVKAYEELEMYDLRDDAERVMRINFPESRFLSELPEVGAKAWWEFWKS